MREPLKGELVAELPRGVTIRLLAEGNREWLLANLREGDRIEREAALKEFPEIEGHEMDHVRHALTVWAGDDLVGMWASYLLPHENEISDRRGWSWETTEHAEKHWRTFVRLTRAVFREIWKREDSWVTMAQTIPWSGYTRTMNWQNRLLGSRTVGEVMVGGKRHFITVFERF